MIPGRAPTAPHAASVAELAENWRTDLAAGLSEAEAARRLERDGPNELPAEKGVPAWRILLSQFANVLILILFTAIALSLLLGQKVEAVVIGAIALFSVLLGFLQEVRAERAMAALRRLASPDATVVREGRERDIPARELVPGDLFVLAAGDVVPADGRLLAAANLRVNEATLTGESSTVGKHAGVLQEPELPLGDRKNLVFASTAVAAGRGRALVVATGLQTELGRIGTLLRTVEAASTPLETNLRRVGRALAWGAAGVVVMVAGTGLLQGRPLLEMVIFGIALAVAVVPEALPAVVTISLALGARRMVRRHALIRRLPTVETLGSVTTICSDKTGTLTTGEMTVREAFVAGETIPIAGIGYEPRGDVRRTPALLELLRCAALSTDAQLIQEGSAWTVRGDPTEGALLVAAAKAGLWKAAIEARRPRVDEIPFSSERKRMTTIHEDGGRRMSISKGAPEVILPSCALAEAERDRALAVAREMGQRALRVLAVARGAGSAEEDMTFLGLVGMIDPPRPEARVAIETCAAAGIRPLMITGDHPLTARAIAAELGLLRRGAVLTGAELERLSDAELEGRVGEIDVFARVSPEHKLRIVAALQRRGEVAAMTGDGVNDAPALKKADVGIAMGVAGTDVAKGAAAMILTDDNFASIVAAVEEGRAIFDNIKKYLMYLLSSNVGEIVLMAAAVALGLPLPLTAVQILYVNLATDGLPALALAVDPHSPDLMRRRPRKAADGIFTRPVTVLILLGGLWSALVNIALFAWALQSGRLLPQAMTMAFVSLVLIQFFKAYSFRSERRSIVERPFSNRWLNRAIVWELAILGLVLYVPPLEAAFGTHPLTAVDWAILVSVAFSIVPVLEAAKLVERRARRPEAAPVDHVPPASLPENGSGTG
jgi:Ca2+-transporting ATPase